MLKTELHTHINADPQDGIFIKYNAFQLIDRAKELNFDVLGITCHNYVYENKEAQEYANNKGILLINGAEVDVQSKHTLIYGINNEDIPKINSFLDLKKLKAEKNLFIIAAHPFYKAPSCLGNVILKYLNLFDAWEYHAFYHKSINPNKKVIRLAKKYNKAVVGNSDVHHLRDLGQTYTLIDAQKNKESVFQAIKDKKCKIVSKPLTLKKYLYVIYQLIYSAIRKRMP